ncbi:hypothetical protein B6A42_26740 (plasmid) [Vibrio coralliilyticus]|nr:hypothetical protein B6A42_26740 [Vibrio coralliilyticus]
MAKINSQFTNYPIIKFGVSLTLFLFKGRRRHGMRIHKTMGGELGVMIAMATWHRKARIVLGVLALINSLFELIHYKV